MIEKIHEGLEEYDRKISFVNNEYSKQSVNTQSAIEVLAKQTKIDYELVEKILNNPISNKFY